VIKILDLVGIGGTFDHLHEGHKFLIKTALDFSKKVVIGLATDELLINKRYVSKIESYKTRKEKIEGYIKTITNLNKVEIIELDTPYGPPINDEDFEGIVVSGETYKNALEINEIRKKKGFKLLIIIVIPDIKNERNEKISSTSIRINLIK